MEKEKLKIISVEETDKRGALVVDTRFYKIDGTAVFGRFQNHPGHYHLGQICSGFNWVEHDMLKDNRYEYALDDLFPHGWEVVEMVEVPYGKQIPDQWDPLNEYLKNGLEGKEVHLWDEERERIINLAIQMNDHRADRGIRYERVKDNIREQSFSDQWFKNNEPCPGLNYGNGTLQDLFMDRKGSPLSIHSSVVVTEKITVRDRMIVATVIQWLGSNVGMAFLGDALKRFDAHIVINSEGKERKL